MTMLRKLKAFQPLLPAEEKVLAEIDSGEFIEIHDGLPPETGGDHDVRATFIRYLALGGCKACRLHEKGLRLVGARITGKLDLEGGDLPRDLGLFDCRFEDEVSFQSAKVQNLFLNGSTLPKGLSADRLAAKGNAFLQGVEAHGAVRLLGATLGGDLVCTGAKFNAAKDESGGQVGFAFAADRLAAKGGAFLRGVEAHGAVRLLGATLGGDLVCAGAKFNAAKDGSAFSAEKLEARGTLFLRHGAEIKGRISLAGAQVGALNDESGCWPEGEGQIDLDRFRYGAILSATPMDAAARIAWLAKIDHGDGFSPQPYEQLAKVLRETGHAEDARVVLIKKEALQRAERRKKRREGLLFEDFYWFSIWDRVMAWTVRYGYRPFGALGWLGGILLLGMMVFGVAEGSGNFKPNDSRVWLSDTWVICGGDVECFMEKDKGKAYPTFNPFIYSADVLLPIVDFDMQDAWIPDEDKAPMVRAYMWLHIALGWFFSLLAVAGFSGLIKPE